MSVPNTFASATSAIPLAKLDANFAYYDAAYNISAGAMTVSYNFAVTGTVSGAGFSNYLASPPAIGGTAAAAGSFTTLTATGAVALSPTSLNVVLSPTGTGVVTINPATAGTINRMSIGATTPSTGAFTTLSASSTVSGAGFSTYLASPPAIGGTTAAAGSFTSLAATSITISGVAVPTISSTSTLTNKRITSRVSSTTSTASITPTVASFDEYAVTAQAVALAINAPTGTPVDGDKLIFRLLDNGTTQTITWDATYTAIGITLPTSTTAGKTTYVGCIYNANTPAHWDAVAVSTQA